MNKVAKNYFFYLSYQILIFLVPLLTTPYVSRVLGAKGLGIFSYANSIVQYFIIFGCIGLNLYGQREIAYNQHLIEKRNKVFWELFTLRIMTVFISLIIYLFLFCISGNYVKVYQIMIFDIIASMIDISWFFQGLEEFNKIVVRNLIVKVSGIILILLFVKSKNDLQLYVLFQSLTLLIGNLSMWLYIPRYVKKIPIRNLEILRHIKPTLVLFLPQVSISLYAIFDKTMIGFLTGLEEEVAYYEQAQKLVKLALAIVTTLGTVMLPRIANLYKKNKMEEIKIYLNNSFKYVLYLSFPMMFGFAVLSKNIVPWFFGDGYDKVIYNIIVISPILLIIAISNIIGVQYLLPTGKQKEYTISVMIGCAVNFILNVILIPRFLSLGAAVATVISEFCVTLTQIIFTRKYIDFKTVIYNSYRSLISSIIMFIVLYLISEHLKSSIFNSALCVCIGFFIYIAILLFLKDDVALDLLKKIKLCKRKL